MSSIDKIGISILRTHIQTFAQSNKSALDILNELFTTLNLHCTDASLSPKVRLDAYRALNTKDAHFLFRYGWNILMTYSVVDCTGDDLDTLCRIFSLIYRLSSLGNGFLFNSDGVTPQQLSPNEVMHFLVMVKSIVDQLDVHTSSNEIVDILGLVDELLSRNVNHLSFAHSEKLIEIAKVLQVKSSKYIEMDALAVTKVAGMSFKVMSVVLPKLNSKQIASAQEVIKVLASQYERSEKQVFVTGDEDAIVARVREAYHDAYIAFDRWEKAHRTYRTGIQATYSIANSPALFSNTPSRSVEARQVSLPHQPINTL